MYFDEVESDNMFFEVCIAVLLLYDSIGASQILKNVGRNVGERFRFKTISRCPYLFFIFCRIVPLGKDSKCR